MARGGPRRAALGAAGGAGACAPIGENASASAAASWRHLVIVHAWNEWGEQAVMEPTAEAGDAMLAAHRAAIGVLEAEVAVAAARARAEALNFSV